MAIEIVAELLAGLGGLGVEVGAAHYRTWRDESYFGELDEDAQRAFLEVVIAAILEDGEESAVESKWLAKREEAGAARALIDEALATVRRELPAGSSPEARAAFVGARGDALGDEESRERAHRNATRILVWANGEGAVATAVRFGVALGMSERDASRAVDVVRSRPLG